MQKCMWPTQRDRQVLEARMNLAANNKVTKYDQLTRTHVF